MNFSRSTILVVGAALLAACGDKVTVTQYTPPATVAKVYGVEVAPATATLTTGASLTFTAAVNADAGVATTVTWTASAGTVTSAGVFTAPSTANAGIAVCATSTVDTGKKGCATVVVQAATAAIPATVSIQSITTGNLNIPVNPANVFGQMDVRLNVNPGNQTVSKVVLLVGGLRADSQTFSAAQAAAMRYAADEAIAQQTIFPQIVFSINTAAFNGTTGVPTWLNGTRAVQAQLYTTQGGTTAAATASVATSLTFNNVDTYTLSLGTLTQKNSAAGFQWSKGDIAASVLPVSYSGRTLTGGSISFGTGAACDNSGVGTRTLALAAPTTGSKWTATFISTDANGPLATNATGYEFNPAGLGCPGIAAGEGFAVTTNDANGTILVGAAPANNPTFRMDNLAPGAVTLAVNLANSLTVGIRTNGWVNDAVKFATTVAADAANGAVAVRPADGGIGGAAAKAQVGGVTMTTPASLAESSAADNYTVSVYNCDALDNCSVNTDATFAVDRTLPTLAFTGGPASNGGYNATTNTIAALAAPANTNFATSVTDPATGASLPSGFLNLAGTPLTLTLSRRNTTDTRYYCTGTGVFQTASTACGTWIATTTSEAANLNFLHQAVAAGNGYVTAAVSVTDQAGNTSAATSRIFAQDLTAPSASLLAPLSVPVDGSALTLSGAMAEDLDLRAQQADFIVGAAGAYNPTGLAAVAGSTDRFFYTAPTLMSSYNPASFTTTGTFNVTIPRFIAQWQVSDGAAPSVITDVAAGVANAVTPVTSVSAAAVNTGSVATISNGAVAFTAFASPWTSGTFQWAAPTLTSTGGTAVTTLNRDGFCSTTTTPTTRVLTAAAIGPTGVFANPFQRVQFWAYQGAGLTAGGLNPSLTSFNATTGRSGWRLVGEVSQATVTDDNVANRTWTYTFTWDPTADQLPFRGLTDCATFDGVRVIAVGLNGGSALATPATATFTVRP